MVRNGIYETYVYRTDREIPIEVHWVHEYSEYGDGSLDSDFECVAYRAGTTSVIELTEDEETKIYEHLKDEGAFA